MTAFTTHLPLGGELGAEPFRRGSCYHHLLAVCSDSFGASQKIKIYLDGIYLGAIGKYNVVTYSGEYNIGRYRGESSPYGPVNGSIDDVRIYNRVLSPSEISTLFVSPSPADQVAPSISAVTASSITTSTAVITWTTDENSTSVVEYGPTTAYGQVASVAGSVTNHSVTITNLASGTTCHYRVRSEDSVGNVGTSIDATFLSQGLLKVVFASNQTGHNEIFAMNLDGTGLTQLTNSAESSDRPIISPNGTKIAFRRGSGSGSTWKLFCMNSDGSGVLQVLPSTSYSHYPCFWLSNTRIGWNEGVSTEEDIMWAVNVDGSNQQILVDHPNDKDVEGDLSPSGNEVVFPFDTGNWTYNRQVRIWNLTNSSETVIRNSDGCPDHWPRFSPDGSKICWVQYTSSGRPGNLFVMNADGTNVSQISFAAGNQAYEDTYWCRQDGRIYCPADLDGQYDLYSMAADGSNVLRLTNTPTINESAPTVGYLNP